VRHLTLGEPPVLAQLDHDQIAPSRIRAVEFHDRLPIEEDDPEIAFRA
jgi:hypothetical protein